MAECSGEGAEFVGRFYHIWIILTQIGNKTAMDDISEWPKKGMNVVRDT